MKRDMDLIRDLLIGIENDSRFNGLEFIVPDTNDNLGVIGVTHHSLEEIAYHLELLIEAGLVKGDIGARSIPAVSRLTWDGHEFVANIRDASIWGKTKERLRDLPDVGLAVIGEIAKAEIKKFLKMP